MTQDPVGIREESAIETRFTLLLSSVLLTLSLFCGWAGPWLLVASSQPRLLLQSWRRREGSATGDNRSAYRKTDSHEKAVTAQIELLDRDPFRSALEASSVSSCGDWDELGLAERPVSGSDNLVVFPPIVSFEQETADLASVAMPDEPEIMLCPVDGAEFQDGLSLAGRIVSDHCNYYSLDTALVAGVGSVVAATFAHSYVDEEIYRRVHHSVWCGDGHDWAKPLHATKILGEGTLTLPIFGGAWLAGEFLDDVPLFDVAGTWGEHSLRAFLVGGPPLLAMQYFTGGSRPMESQSGSAWRPFQDSNGASGHAFMGALPLLTAAEMIDWWPGKIAFVVVSLFPGLSRVADDDHYASQAILGWTMAYVAVTAVDRTDNPDNHVSIFPLITGDYVGVAAEYRW